MRGETITRTADFIGEQPISFLYTMDTKSLPVDLSLLQTDGSRLVVSIASSYTYSFVGGSDVGIYAQTTGGPLAVVFSRLAIYAVR